MANSELYRPIQSIQIKGFSHSEIQGTPVPSKGIPIKEGHIPQFSIVAAENKEATNDNSLNFTLRQISPHHGRSYEFPMGKEGSIIFSDEYDNIYTSITTKGNNLTNPHTRRSEIAPSGIAFHGLQDSDSMVRALRASQLLRSNGVVTELFIKVIEPLQLPYKEDVVALDEFKRKLVQQVWEDNVESDDESRKLTRLDIPKLAYALDDMTFFITIRGMQVPERINDILYAQDEEEKNRIMNRAFRYINLDEQRKAEKDPAYIPRILSVENRDDIDVYYTLLLPQEIGKNIAKMHKLGLIHKYPHIANISTVGSIYDLDSVEGEPLGLSDPPVTKEDTIKDAKEFIYGHASWPVPSHLAILFRVEHGADLFRGMFLDTYAREMGYVGNIEHFADLAALWKEFDDKEHLGALDLYLEEVFEQQNIDFEYFITPQEVAEFIAAKLPIEGGTMRTLVADESHTDETYKQATLAAAIFCDVVSEDLREACSEKGLDQKSTEDQLETFVDYFRSCSLLKVNQATSEMWSQVPEDGGESFKKQKAEEYINKPKSEQILWFEQEFLRSLIWEWGWEEDVGSNLDKIKKLYEDNGIQFKDELTRYYLEDKLTLESNNKE